MSKKISFVEELELACHMQRKINRIMDGAIGGDRTAEKIANDMEAQFKREFGIKKRFLKVANKHLLDAHEFIDDYEPPKAIVEKLETLKRKNKITEKKMYF